MEMDSDLHVKRRVKKKQGMNWGFACFVGTLPSCAAVIFEESTCIAEEQPLKSSSLVFSIGLFLAVCVTIKAPVRSGCFFT